MKRRKFLNWAGIGLLASYFPVALAACSQESSEETPKQPQANVPDAEGYLAVGTVQELSKNGYIINSKSNVIVFRNGSNSFAAVSLLCTHQGCKVDWKQSSNILVCPCHGSQFAANGKVLTGPAQSPLSTFEVKEEKESILVKVA